TSVSPCDDFYQYACGNWIKRKYISEDQTGVTEFGILRDNLNKQLRFSIEKENVKPLRKYLRQLGGWPLVEKDVWNETDFDWIETLVKMKKLGYSHNILISISVLPDIKDSEKNIIHIDQPSLGTPNRKYLLKGMNDSVLKAYRKVMIESGAFLGVKNRTYLENEVNKIIAFETKLAESIDHSELVIVRVPSYLSQLESLLLEEDKRVIANYMIWRAVFSSLGQLDTKWRHLAESYDRVLSGRSIEKPRHDTCIRKLMNRFGIALSAMYIRDKFDEESREKAYEMVDYIKRKFLNILKSVNWMDEKTRQRAIEKAQSIRTQIGYSKELLNNTKVAEIYQNLTLDAKTYFETVQKIRRFWTEKELSKLREPYLKNDWKRFAKPATINAFYNALENSIKFPAGILQGVFFAKDRPNYLNYGGIGYIIGHEITHGFDDKGRQFDKNGNNENWWETETDKKFKQRVTCIIEQYGNYTVDEINENINGVNTQGENIADNGGLKHAFLAYKDYVKDKGEEPLLPGLSLTQEQLFFVSAANVWCAKIRPQSLKLRVQTGVHSPPRFRVIGPMSNMHEFSEAFNCPPGSRMNPIDKCEVW
ncbi:membrane metallo-endopeptidase-like 1, partial [Dinothrombium tinctorium]